MRTSSLFFVFGAASVLTACGNKDTTTEPALTTATSSTGSGSGGAATSTTSTAGAGGADAGPPACPTCVNGCHPLKPMDLTAMTDVTILFGGNTGFMYSPACIKLKTGTKVTWSGDFSLHPLEAGTVLDGVTTADPMSPIMPMASGTMETVTFDKAGTFGFYCGVHQFAGAAFVQP